MAVVWTSPLVAALGVSLTIPVAMLEDMVIHGRQYSAVYIIGSAQVSNLVPSNNQNGELSYFNSHIISSLNEIYILNLWMDPIYFFVVDYDTLFLLYYLYCFIWYSWDLLVTSTLNFCSSALQSNFISFSCNL